MTIIEAPTEYTGSCISLFLAGGISDCENWQAAMIELLRETNLVLLNPRRHVFDVKDKSMSETQIAWEFRHLCRATAAMFWFPPQTLCPIALYELGRWATSARPLFVGCDPKYARNQDVVIQMHHARPDVCVGSSLQDIAREVRTWASRYGRDVA